MYRTGFITNSNECSTSSESILLETLMQQEAGSVEGKLQWKSMLNTHTLVSPFYEVSTAWTKFIDFLWNTPLQLKTSDSNF